MKKLINRFYSKSESKKLFLVILLPILFLCGCYTPKKAAEQTHRALDKYQTQTLDIVSKQFPCITDTIIKGDSSELKKWISAVNSTAEFYDSLLANVEPEKIIIKEDGDSVNYKTCSENNLILKKKVSTLEKSNFDLRSRFLTIPVLHDTVFKEDRRITQILRNNLRDAELNVVNLTDKNNTLQSKVYSRGKENWIWRIIATLFIILWIYRKYRNITSFLKLK